MDREGLCGMPVRGCHYPGLLQLIRLGFIIRQVFTKTLRLSRVMHILTMTTYDFPVGVDDSDKRGGTAFPLEHDLCWTVIMGHASPETQRDRRQNGREKQSLLPQ